MTEVPNDFETNSTAVTKEYDTSDLVDPTDEFRGQDDDTDLEKPEDPRAVFNSRGVRSRVLNIITLEELREVRISRYPNPKEIFADDEVLHVLTLAGCLWKHSGNPEHPHVELTTGLCTDEMCNMSMILKYPNWVRILAVMMKRKLDRIYEGRVRPDWVIGSDHNGASFSLGLAEEYGAFHDFCEKGEDKSQNWFRHQIDKEAQVLVADDIPTTFHTSQMVMKGVRSAHKHGINFIPVLPFIVNRSGESQFVGMDVVSLLDKEMRTWKQSECPLCAKGSKPLRPKENWQELKAA